WGGSLTSTLTSNFVLELRYRGWWADDWDESQTGSFEEPFIDYSPPDGGPATYSGGRWYPWDYVTWRQQLNAKATYYAEDFLNSEHEFKFGVQYSRGSAKTNGASGPNGTYLYHYTYDYYGYEYDYLIRASGDPYQYGGVSTDVGIFLDDSITVNDRLTLNLGVRFDRNRGSIPDYERLTVGEPSVSPAGNFAATGETVPGAEGLVEWNLISPRLGFAFQPTGDGRSVIRGSFGVYYDGNIMGNWDYPPPGIPTMEAWALDPVTMQPAELWWDWSAGELAVNPDLKAPRTLQYAIGFEQQVSDEVSIGAQYVHKTAKDLVGWEIMGDGTYDEVPFTDPFTGNQYTMLSVVEPYTARKGNDPGEFPGSEDMDYYQKYHGVILTFDKRFADNWGLSASYTWSRSEGRIPRMLSQEQFNPFYTNKDGRDPNQWLNTDSRLQADRPHMFRLQSVVRLPWEIRLSASVDLSSGRPHSRQIEVFGLEQGSQTVIMEPIGTYSYKPIKSVDVLLGKRFHVGEEAYISLEAWGFNLLNSDQELSMASLVLQEPGEDFVPDWWVTPRRLQLRVGFNF
ncbi:MAG: TonB-dependent receptor, partial [Dehalococcoidia bacterium]